MKKLKSLCVYCGSSSGRIDDYADAARALAQAMVPRGIRLVYGGAHVGIMGTVADEVLRLGGEAVGVIPESLMKKELAHQGLTELHVTPSMHARKTLMAELADGFVALPGGIGTFEEIFEVDLGAARFPQEALRLAQRCRLLRRADRLPRPLGTRALRPPGAARHARRRKRSGGSARSFFRLFGARVAEVDEARGDVRLMWGRCNVTEGHCANVLTRLPLFRSTT